MREERDYMHVYGPAHSWVQLSNSLLQYCQHANITLHNLFALQMAISIATNACTAIYRWQLDATLMRFGVRHSHQKLLLSVEHRRTDPHEKACFFASLHLNSPLRQSTARHAQSCHVCAGCVRKWRQLLHCPDGQIIVKTLFFLGKRLRSYHIVISKTNSRMFWT